jgi:hypothetical protein
MAHYCYPPGDLDDAALFGADETAGLSDDLEKKRAAKAARFTLFGTKLILNFASTCSGQN